MKQNARILGTTDPTTIPEGLLLNFTRFPFLGVRMLVMKVRNLRLVRPPCAICTLVCFWLCALVTVALAQTYPGRPGRSQTEKSVNAVASTWIDPITHLMWTKRDNGGDVGWYEAQNHCQNLQLGGYRDWRMPTLGELGGIYDKSVSVHERWQGITTTNHVKGNLHLSGGMGEEWSSDPGDADGTAAYFMFWTGYRPSRKLDEEGGVPVLCVRDTPAAGPKAVNIPLFKQPLTWTDSASALIWTKRDNRNDLTWQQAMDYCRDLQLDGQSNWRLPSINELQGIYDANVNIRGVCCTWHVKGDLELSGVHWSSTRESTSGAALTFAFDDGKQRPSPLSRTFITRALCVRRESTNPGESSPSSVQVDARQTPRFDPSLIPPFPVSSAVAKKPEKVALSAGASMGLLLTKTPPVYPDLAKAARVSGTVVLQATISKTGSIENFHVISGPAMLQEAALNAVRQWRYRPYLLNNEPVEVETTVDVIFTLGG